MAADSDSSSRATAPTRSLTFTTPSWFKSIAGQTANGNRSRATFTPVTISETVIAANAVAPELQKEAAVGSGEATAVADTVGNAGLVGVAVGARTVGECVAGGEVEDVGVAPAAAVGVADVCADGDAAGVPVRDAVRVANRVAVAGTGWVGDGRRVGARVAVGRANFAQKTCEILRCGALISGRSVEPVSPTMYTALPSGWMPMWRP
jgi:hypothetical protein